MMTTVSEEGLPDGIPDDIGSPDDITDSNIFNGNISVTDADGDSLTVTLENPPADGAFKSGGVDIIWSGQGTSTLVGTAATDTIITISISDNGDYTVNLNGPIDHSIEDVEDIESFNVTVRASDGAQSSTGTLTVNIEDDSPVDISPDAAFLLNQISATFTGDLDIDDIIDNNVGADQPGSIQFSETLESITDTGLFSGALPISYDVSSDGLTLTGYTVTNPVSSGGVFTITLNPDATPGGDDQYTVTMNATVDGGAMNIDFNAGGYDFKGGNVNWAGFNTTSDDDSKDLLLTPIVAGTGDGTVNTNANEGGIDSNNVGSGQAMRVDFVTDLRGTPLSGKDFSTNQTQEFDGHYNVNGSSAMFTATSGSTIRIKTFDDDDSGILKTVGDGTQDSITAVGIAYGDDKGLISFDEWAAAAKNSDGEATITVNGHDFFVKFDPSGDAGTYEAVVSSVVEGSMISTYTSDGYNSIEYHHESDDSFDDTFKIGDFGTTVVDPGEPVEFEVPVEIIDADGDVASGTIDIFLLPEGSQDFSESLTGESATSTEEAPHIIGSDHTDTLSGDAQDNILYGGDGDDNLSGADGDDTLHGGAGDDTLTGGADDDTMTGGPGADTFKAGDGDDHITDYEKGVDDLNVSEVPGFDHLGNQIIESDEGTAKVVLYDDEAAEIGSITFDNVDFNDPDLDPTDLTTLLGDDDPEA
jgi:hypothetical protein